MWICSGTNRCTVSHKISCWHLTRPGPTARNADLLWCTHVCHHHAVSVTAFMRSEIHPAWKPLLLPMQLSHWLHSLKPFIHVNISNCDIYVATGLLLSAHRRHNSVCLHRHRLFYFFSLRWKRLKSQCTIGACTHSGIGLIEVAHMSLHMWSVYS